ncbi:Ribonuclease HII [uncultured archaeon]|nr:Ribonuclease HII [uncultured archaeon]
MLIAGIDEAGRGPCIGPMMMAVASIEKSDEEKLLDIGVKDSKLLSPKERERQFPLIKKALREHIVVGIEPQEIDRLMVRKSLNEIEAMHAARLLNGLEEKPEVVYVDSPDVVMAEFGKRIAKFISFPVKIISEHKADLNYPVVSAASVIAKVERDKAIKKLSQEFGNVGSGYPGDDATIRFLRKYLLQHGSVPPFARNSWETIKVMQEEKFQKKLF